MVFIFNFIGLGMLAIAFCVWFALAGTVPQIGGGVILGIAIGVLFFVDVLYRIFTVRKKVEVLKAEVATGVVKPARTDLIVVLPTPISAAISGKGGIMMFFPVWLFSILLALLIFVVL